MAAAHPSPRDPGSPGAEHTPTPFDHLPPGTWARVRAEDIADGDTLALRMSNTAAEGGSPDLWVWRLTAADLVRTSERQATIRVYGLGPDFIVRATARSGPHGTSAEAVWELWKFYPAPPPSPTPPVPPADELAEARIAKALREAADRKPPTRYTRLPDRFPDLEL
jgi:hypothetical protein